MSKTRGARWTKELELKLVKHYRKFSCLWMTSLPGYKDLDKRYAAYVKIVEGLRPEFPSLTVPKVVYKIRDLRYRYCVELTKIERAAATCERNFITNFHCFQCMNSFLDLRYSYDENKIVNSLTVCDEASEESKLEDTNAGIFLRPSRCRTIYDNRLKMIEESESDVGEFEESNNDEEDSGPNDERYDQIEGRCNIAELSRKEVKKIATVSTRAKDEQKKRISDGKLHREIKLGAKETKILRSNENEKEIRTTNDVEENVDNYLSKSVKYDEFNAFAVSIASQLRSVDPKILPQLEVTIFMILEEERAKNNPQYTEGLHGNVRGVK